MVTESSTVSGVVNQIIKYNVTSGYHDFAPINISPTVLDLTKKLVEWGKITEADELAYSQRAIFNSPYPNYLQAGLSYATWEIGTFNHRDDDKPALIRDGYIMRMKNGMRHNVKYPSVIKEEGMEIHPKLHDSTNKLSYYLFGKHVLLRDLQAIKRLTRLHGYPLEVSFLLHLNQIDLKDWEDASDLPLNWQLNALKGVDFSHHIDRWVSNKKTVDSYRGLQNGGWKYL